MEIEKPARVKRKVSQIRPITSVNQVGKLLDVRELILIFILCIKIESKTRSKLFMDACNLAQQGHYEKAKTLFLGIDTNCREYGRAQYLLGCACNKLDEYKQAISAFTKAVQNLKEMIPVELFYQEGIAHWKLGACEDAIKSFSRFIRETEEENAHNGYLSRALVYGSMDHYEKALSDLNKANEHEEHRTTYSLCCRGRIFAHLGQYENAKKDFQAASYINPQDFQSHLQLGIIYSELGQYSRALKEFDRASHYSPDNNNNRAEICFRQALIYHSLKDFDTATEKLVEAVNRNPKHARACFRLGRAYIAAGNYSKALEVLNTAHTLAPHDKDIIYELSILHERVDRSKLALYEKRRAFGLQTLEPSREETSDPEKQIVDDGPTSSQPTSLPPSVEARRYVNLHLKSAIEQEESLPMAVNHLASYYKILEEYKLAFDSGKCPEAQAFLALCQEAQQDFVGACDSMNKLYDELQNNPNAYRLWRDNLNELKKDKELERLVIHRYVVIERIQRNISDIQKDHEEFKNDPSKNRKHFYDTLRRRLNQTLVAFSVAGCSTSIVAHNLKGSISK
jgi:tetratricopeptide (TPR) repeat protein